MRLLTNIVFFTAFSITSALAEDFSVVGGYGFDWLHPKSTECRRINRSGAAKLKRCELKSPGNAFGLSLPYYQCKPSKGSEYLIYASKAHCKEAFETMQANEP